MRQKNGGKKMGTTDDAHSPGPFKCRVQSSDCRIAEWKQGAEGVNERTKRNGLPRICNSSFVFPSFPLSGIIRIFPLWPLHATWQFLAGAHIVVACSRTHGQNSCLSRVGRFGSRGS